MPLHTDKRGFVYATKRQGGRVLRRYIGKATARDVAALLALDATARETRAKARALEEEQRAQRDGAAPDLAPLQELETQIGALVSDALEAAGFHWTRGQWRKSRKGEPMTKALERQEEARKAKRETLKKRAQNGDGDAAREFWRELDADALATPEGAQERAQLVCEKGDAMARGLALLVAKFTPGNPLATGAIQRQLEEMNAQLCGPNPTPIEAILVKRVCVCWLQLATLDHGFANTLNGTKPKAEESLSRQLDSANKRYLSSLKTLAQVRRLQLPTLQAIQVNFGALDGPSDAPKGAFGPVRS